MTSEGGVEAASSPPGTVAITAFSVDEAVANGTFRWAFAVYEARSLPFHADPDDDWGWHVKVERVVDVDFVHDGVPLEDLNVDGRDLRRSIRQHSAIRLSDAEGKVAAEQIKARG